MGAIEEAVVRRFYDEMCSGRRNDLAAELFSADHVLYDPQVPVPNGPAGMVAAVSTYQNGVDGHWAIEELFGAGDKVVVRWTGSGTHNGELNGMAPTGRPIRVDAITVHTVRDGKICETREVWDTLGMLIQLGAIPGEGAAAIKSGYEAFARGDVAAVLALFDPAIVWSVPDTVPIGGTHVGPAAVGQFFAQLAETYQELQVTPETYVEQGENVIVTGTHRGLSHSGTRFAIPFVHAWTVRNGKLAGFTEYFDTLRLNEALGVPGAADVIAAARVPVQVNLRDQAAQPVR